MDDKLTDLVLSYQSGKISLSLVRNQVLLVAFDHLRRYRRKGEDEVSDFLLILHGRIEGLLDRFQHRGLPFRHYLLRCLRWQWNTFQTERAKEKRRVWLATSAVGTVDDLVAEPDEGPYAEPSLSPTSTRRLVLLALKAAPYLEDSHLEAICRHTGVDLAWLQACQTKLRAATDGRKMRRDLLIEKRGEAYCRRLIAEDEALREADPERRALHERRAGLYRNRLARLNHEQSVTTSAPTHLELSALLGMPKGSIDSSLYHLKKELSCVYSGGHDHPSGHEQPPQETRARVHLP